MREEGIITNARGSTEYARANSDNKGMDTSLVAMNRVPMFIPHAPRAREAASCFPSAHPPLAMKGIPSLRAA